MIVVVGAGRFGLAIAYVLAENGHDVVVMTRRHRVISYVDQHKMLPGYESISTPKNLRFTTELNILKAATRVVLAVPTQHLRAFIEELRSLLPDVPYLLLQKGIEKETGLLPSEIAQDGLLESISVLSGPNFAQDIVMNLPTATTISSKNLSMGFEWATLFQSQVFRPYAHDDIIGAQIGGAFKNVVAIACGVVQGLNLGDNAIAAIITRGMTEMVRLGMAMGAKVETFLGLSGLGDLTLTCHSDQSRNLRYGKALAVQNVWDELKDGTVEGYHTAFSVAKLQKKYGIEMPISECVLSLIQGAVHPEAALQQLMGRSVKQEVI